MGIPVISTTTLTAAGQIKASVGYLFWFICANTSGSNRKCIFNNATTGTGGKMFTVNVAAGATESFAFPIALYFGTGIRIGTFEADLDVTCGYQ